MSYSDSFIPEERKMDDDCEECAEAEEGVCDYHLGFEDGWEACRDVIRRNN